MKPQPEKWEIRALRTVWKTLGRLVGTAREHVNSLNSRMAQRYSARRMALLATALAGVLASIMLFVPPYLGLSDDGSFARVMAPAGIYHREGDAQSLYFNYYVRLYATAPAQATPAEQAMSSTTYVARLARLADDFFSGDLLFDLRTMGALYLLAYLPALYVLIRQALTHVTRFAEGAVVAFTGVLLFADVSYITYFASFYCEPLQLVALVACAGAALSLRRQTKWDYGWLLLYVCAGLVLTMTQHRAAILGLALAVLCIKLLFAQKDFLWRSACIGGVLALCTGAFTAQAYLPTESTVASKYHAMTRGVLLQSTNLDETLAEFGIGPSYAVLADTSANDYYPLTSAYNPALEKGFYDRYDMADIALYYLRHPRAMAAMLDIATKVSFDVRKSYSGNYEQTTGMPPRAKSLFWSAWSNFKINAAPHTFGFIVLLAIAAALLFGRRTWRSFSTQQHRQALSLEVLLLVLAMGLLQAVVGIVRAGDAELARSTFLLGVGIDIVCYVSIAELLQKLNILSDSEEGRRL